MGLMSFGLVGLGLALVGDPDETITYVYDAQGRLVGVQRAGDVNDGVVTTYTFDEADNRTGKVTVVPPAFLAAPVREATEVDDASGTTEDSDAEPTEEPQ